MKRLADSHGFDTVTRAFYVTIHKGTTGALLRGFLIAGTISSNPKVKYYFYDTDKAAWYTLDLSTGATPSIPWVKTATQVSVACTGRFCYIAGTGQSPVVLYNNSVVGATPTNDFVKVTMGPGVDFDTAGDAGLLAPTAVGEVAGYLKTGVYNFAYRYYDPTRGVYSDISDGLTYNLTTDDKKVTLNNPDTIDLDRAYQQGYRKLLIYRTLSVSIAGNSVAAGLYYLETTYDLDTDPDCWPAAVYVGNERDEALFFNAVYDPVRDVTGTPPSVGEIAVMDGTAFIGGDPSGSLVATTQLQWSPLHLEEPEVFPPTNVLTWGWADGHVLRLVQAGDALFAFTKNAVFRIIKYGAQITVARIHGGRSITGRDAVAEVGRDLLAVTPLGVTIIDSATGSLQTLGSLDRLILDDWASNVASLIAVTDSATAATYILNPTLGEAAVVWHTLGTTTTLADCDFTAAVSGPHPESGGPSRAFFLTNVGPIVYPDEDRTDTGTMLGVHSACTLNSTATAGGNNTLTDAASAGWTTARLLGARIYLWSAATPTAAPQSRIISTVSGTGSHVITVTANWTTNPVSGDRYTISPVPFKVRLWPMGPAGSPEESGRRVVSDIGVVSMNHSGMTNNANAIWRVGVCRNMGDTPSVVSVVAASENPSEQHAAVAADGYTIEPWVEIESAGVDFELLGASLVAKITGSRNMGD
jgi:hypothetical protein